MGFLIVFGILAVIVLGVLLWLLFDESIATIKPGELGLVLANGQPTDKALQPGIRWVPTLRRLMVQIYPSLEMSYRAGAAPDHDESADLERSGPPVRGVLGDRTSVDLSYTLRFRIDPSKLRHVHERFGNEGLWSAARDLSGAALRTTLNSPDIGVDNVFGPRRHALEAAIAEAASQRLGDEGFEVTAFSITDIDLGRAGETVQAIVRARLELEREQAEAAMRLARAQADAELEPYLSGTSLDAALRYRETDVWRDVAHALADRMVVMPTAPRRSASEAVAIAAAEAVSEPEAESTE